MFLRDGYHTARKIHHDNGYEYFSEWIRDIDLGGGPKITDEEMVFARQALAQPKPWLIKPGEQYYFNVNIAEGDFGVWKTKKLFEDLSTKYKYPLYPEY